MSKRSYIHEIRRGLIRVRVRVQRTQRALRYSLSVVRVYRNGDQWKESSRFGRDDIPLMRLALDEAYGWILLQQAGESIELLTEVIRLSTISDKFNNCLMTLKIHLHRWE